MIFFSIQSVSLILVGVVNLVLGIIIYLRDRQNKSNVLFALVTVSVSWWVLSRALFEIIPDTSPILFWGYLLYVSAIFIPLFFTLFTYTFPSEKFLLSKWQVLFITFPALAIVWLTLTPGAVLETIGQRPEGYKFIEFGNGYFFYTIYILSYFLWGFVNLVLKYRKSTGLLRVQLRYVFLGTFIASLFGVGTNLILPIFGSFRFFWIGPVMTFIMIIFLAYAIVKHHLLNIKVIATEIFAASIFLVVLGELLLAKSDEELITRFIIVLLVGFFVYLLIRSILQDLKQREKIELLANDLEKANKRLKILDQQKSEFVSIASHQLRSPLTAITGYASMMTEGSFGIVSDKAKEAVRRIFESSQHLATVVDDLLNVTKIEQGGMKFEFSKVDFRRMIKDLTEELSPNISRAGLKLTLGDNGHHSYFVNADYEKLRQVVANLIDNAIKYTPKGEILVFLAEDDALGRVTLSVKDSGIGVPKELQSRLFEKFSRGEGISKINIGGSGLGLYVAKEIVNAHGGRIWVESDGEGNGSTFFVELEEYGHTEEARRASKFAEQL
ncbi:MAG: ATP-binding protein [Patescibacteria group bacterium]